MGEEYTDVFTVEIGEEYTNYIVQVSPYDCTGCNLCVKNCPALNKEVEGRKAINMESIEVVGEEENARWDFFQTIPYVEKQKLNSQKKSGGKTAAAKP